VFKNCIQYCLARNWPMKIYFLAAALLGEWFVLTECQPSAALLHDWEYLLMFVPTIVLMPVLCCAFAVVPAPLILVPIFRLGAKLNGAPFHVGDPVRILVGPHRNHLTRIYEIWDERREVRVELDPQARESVKDVFEFTQVCRENAAVKPPP
jgi:hypothetical protein